MSTEGENLVFVVPSIMLCSSEISPTRCNNCVFILRNGFTPHVSGDTPNFYPTLQVLDMSTLGDTADANSVNKFLPHTLHVYDRNLITGMTSAASPRVDISSTCKVGQKLGVSLPC